MVFDQAVYDHVVKECISQLHWHNLNNNSHFIKHIKFQVNALTDARKIQECHILFTFFIHVSHFTSHFVTSYKQLYNALILCINVEVRNFRRA